MAAKEIYDYVSVAVPDYDYTLTIEAQGVLRESAIKNQVLHRADNYNREVVSLNIGAMWFVEWDWAILTEAESGTVFDLYHDSDKANGRANSFKWDAHDGHTYVVAFDCDLSRVGRNVDSYRLPKLRLEVVGKITD